VPSHLRRTGVLVGGTDVFRRVHEANLAVARATPGEQPYVVGWDLLATDAGTVVVLDVDDDPAHLATWCSLVGGTISPAEGTPLPEDAEVRVVELELDDESMAAQQHRDGLLDRFHVTREAALAFGDEARAFIGDSAVFYCIDTAGVRTYWPSSPLEPPLTQTLDDVAIGYGGPVGWSVTAVDDDGWRRVEVGALGRVSWAQWVRG
jgi:hypothetical protein